LVGIHHYEKRKGEQEGGGISRFAEKPIFFKKFTNKKKEKTLEKRTSFSTSDFRDHCTVIKPKDRARETIEGKNQTDCLSKPLVEEEELILTRGNQGRIEKKKPSLDERESKKEGYRR